MTDNTFNLSELDELKQAYQLIDEKLDGKEIVTPEQIRTVTLKNIGFFKTVFKRDVTWSTLAFVPIAILYLVLNNLYTVKSLSILCIYYAIDLTLRFLLVRRMNRVDFSTLDVKTLLEEEKNYMKANAAIAFFAFTFWIAYGLIYFNYTVTIIYAALLLLLIVSRTSFFKRSVIRSLATPIEAVEIGKGRQIFIWFFSILLILVLIPLSVGYVMDITANGFDLFKFLLRIGYLFAYLSIILQGLFLKKIMGGQAPIMTKVTSILAIVCIILTIIPAIIMYINNNSVVFTNIFPAFLAIMVLYLNTTPRKQ